MKLRQATDTDRDLFFRLRNDPTARHASRRPEITEDEHARWWKEMSDYCFVCDGNEGPVGTLRLSADGMVSIIVDPALRGMGLGVKMLRLLTDEAKRLGFTRIFAEISPENVRSQKAFLTVGYKPVLLELPL